MSTCSSSSSSHQEKAQFPLDPSSYRILAEIGNGVSAVVYKAVCVPMDSAVVAIKSIDLDQSRADFDSLRRETKTLSLLHHPNVLSAHCSFAVGRRLWVVMPFMSAGSLQSIIASSFPLGLPEPCIAVVLRETLSAMKYLHHQGHLHRDIKAGNILIDANGSVKVADFGVSASVYEANSTRLSEVAGTPYWMAPEVIHSHNGYGCKADIWSFGITALELARGGPPVSNLPPSKSLLLKITTRFRFSDYYQSQSLGPKDKRFSKGFKDLVGSCLDQDPNRRPSAEKLLRHSFFRNCKGLDFLVKNVVVGLPPVEERFKKARDLMKEKDLAEEDDEDEDELRMRAKNRRISGWNFNEDGFDLDPVFPAEAATSVVKMVRFGGETVIQEKGGEPGESNPGSPGRVGEGAAQVGVTGENVGVDMGGSGGGALSGNVGVDMGAMPEVAGAVSGNVVGGISGGGGAVGSEAMMGALGANLGAMPMLGAMSGNVGDVGGIAAGGIDREALVGSLVEFTRSLEDQRQNVMTLIGLLRGEVVTEVSSSREEQMGQVIERLRVELENERERNFQLEMELEFLKIQIYGANSPGAAGNVEHEVRF